MGDEITVRYKAGVFIFPIELHTEIDNYGRRRTPEQIVDMINPLIGYENFQRRVVYVTGELAKALKLPLQPLVDPLQRLLAKRNQLIMETGLTFILPLYEPFKMKSTYLGRDKDPVALYTLLSSNLEALEMRVPLDELMLQENLSYTSSSPLKQQQNSLQQNKTFTFEVDKDGKNQVTGVDRILSAIGDPGKLRDNLNLIHGNDDFFDYPLQEEPIQLKPTSGSLPDTDTDSMSYETDTNEFEFIVRPVTKKEYTRESYSYAKFVLKEGTRYIISLIPSKYADPLVLPNEILLLAAYSVAKNLFKNGNIATVMNAIESLLQLLTIISIWVPETNMKGYLGMLAIGDMNEINMQIRAIRESQPTPPLPPIAPEPTGIPPEITKKLQASSKFDPYKQAIENLGSTFLQ